METFVYGFVGGLGCGIILVIIVLLKFFQTFYKDAENAGVSGLLFLILFSQKETRDKTLSIIKEGNNLVTNLRELPILSFLHRKN